MSGPDGIDERFGTLVGELRSGEVTANPALRERVRAIARREPEPPAARLQARLPRRRIALVLVPALALLAGAVVAGVVTSGGTSRRAQHGADVQRVASGQAGLEHAPPSSPPLAAPPTPAYRAALSPSAAPAPSGSRAQIYSADLRLRVRDLSGATKQAIRLTRGWGGYVVTVDYGSGRKSGAAYLVVRVPIAKVQTAIARLTALGTILADRVSIQDVQGQLNRRFGRIVDLRAQIASLRAKLSDPTLTQSQRSFFEAAIGVRQAKLARLQDEQQAQKTRAGFATVALNLETKRAAVPAPSKPSRIGDALRNIGRVLVTEVEILLYVLLIGAPLVLVAALLWLGLRSLRRRSEEQLLAR
jgi:Domain of unknown function (DUF4349)